MKKSIKLSIAMALMMGASAGINAVAPQTASAEISDKFRMEVNGYRSYNHDSDCVGYTYVDKNGRHKDNYWSGYTRLVLTYNVDKNTTFRTRLHSDYENVGDFLEAQNTNGAYFDQAYLELKDRPAKMTYTLGKKGAYMGQGMVYNSSGNLTGAAVQLGNWWEPNNVAIYYGDRKNGDRIKAINASLGVAKDAKISVVYLDATKSTSYTNVIPTTFNTAGKDYDVVEGTSTRVYEAGRVYDNLRVNGRDTYRRNQILSFGTNIKLPGVTVVGEYARNLSGEIATNNNLKGWYVELYTGPTSDMTSGLPVQKPGTNVWSLKYQDIGTRATYVHNTTFVDGMKGWRLNYGHTFKKGISADIAWGRYQDKATKEKNKDIVVAEVCYKFR